MTAQTSKPSGEIIVHVFGKTDVGRTREHNEDAFVVADLTTMNATLKPEVRSHRLGERGSLFMVADGMGGAAAGEIASAMAIDVVLHELETRWSKAADADPETFARALKAATETANARIHRFAGERPENRGMGTTATIAGLVGDTLYLAQVGDSRAYLVRDGVALQITKDQSLMQKLVEAGELTAEEAEVSERRNIILQALGPEPLVKVDLTHQQVRRGDTVVVCSDGLSGQMRASDIAEIVAKQPDLVQVCKELIDLANENGGPDNITVIAARFEGDGLIAASESDAVGHAVYTNENESRTTLPVRAADLPPITPEEEASMAETPRETPVPTWTPAADGGAVTGPAPAPLSPPARPVSLATLRLIFGAIGVLIGALVIYKFLK